MYERMQDWKGVDRQGGDVFHPLFQISRKKAWQSAEYITFNHKIEGGSVCSLGTTIGCFSFMGIPSAKHQDYESTVEGIL